MALLKSDTRDACRVSDLAGDREPRRKAMSKKFNGEEWEVNLGLADEDGTKDMRVRPTITTWGLVASAPFRGWLG